MKEFADNLKRLRHEKKMSQVELANISCISIKSIQNYEQNRDGRAPTLHNLMLLADIFNVTPYYLYYGGTNEMNSNSLYMNEVLSEISQLPFDAIKKIHDSPATGISLPKLCISDALISKIAGKLNFKVCFPQRGLYKPYIEQTLIRYAQDRQNWKKTYNLQ